MGRRIVGEEESEIRGRRRRFKGVEGGLQGRREHQGAYVPKKQGVSDWGQKCQPREESHGGEVRGSRRFAEIWADEGEDRGARHLQGP